jgi:hypothetical protein
MANFTVTTASLLGSFLRQNGVQQWRIPVLTGCGGVRVIRDRAFIQLNGAETRLQQNDLVQIVDPLPDACAAALRRIPAADFRDYAFVPGTSPFDLKMAGVMDHRPQTIRINDPLIDSLAGFIRAFSSSALITNPIRSLVIASHANPEGLLFLALTIASPNRISFEDLEAAVNSKLLVVAPNLLEPRPNDSTGSPIAAAFLIRGCRIGSTLPYLRKLKEALGNNITVIAPKHFHIAAQNTRPAGFVEYMGYNFAINRPRPFANRAATITDFSTAGFTRIDGQPVPARLWSTWLPARDREINQVGEQQIPTTIISPITNAQEAVPARYRYRQRQWLEQEGSFGLDPDPGTEAGRKQAVRDEFVRQLARYRPDHPFPEYVRYGYNSMDEFIAGWTWTFRYQASNHTLFFNATRHEYTLIQPIVDPTTNRLLMNFYPSGPQGSVIELMLTSDTRFFASV